MRVGVNYSSLNLFSSQLTDYHINERLADKNIWGVKWEGPGTRDTYLFSTTFVDLFSNMP